MTSSAKPKNPCQENPAKDYLNYSSFSDSGLYDQLIFEGYTAEEAQYAINNIPK